MTENKNKTSLILFLIPSIGSLAIFIAISYFLQREDSFLLLTGYILLFLAYFSFIFNATHKKHVYGLVYVSLLFRLSFLFAIP
ncbi:MAG: hypothetical protein M3421_05110, partial [Bacteroidota bacterium]|nr:hypothetical protein [Bacteroidota bacterium]